MKQNLSSPQQIAFALRQAETGTPVDAVCRKPGMSQAHSLIGKKVQRISGPRSPKDSTRRRKCAAVQACFRRS